MKKRFLFSSLLMIIISFSTSAQFRVGGQASGLVSFLGFGTAGVGLNGEYVLNDKVNIHGAAEYYFPGKISYEESAYAMSSTTTPSSVDVTIDHKISFINAFIGGKYFLGTETEDDFGFYGIAEAGLLIAMINTTAYDYDQTLYTTTADDEESENWGNFTVNLGVGANYNIGIGYLFTDLKANLPAANYNSRSGYDQIVIPASLSLTGGLRIPLGN